MNSVLYMFQCAHGEELRHERTADDPEFAVGSLGGIDALLAGNLATGKMARDYIKTTIGFEQLGEATGVQPKSPIRMLGPRAPQAKNLFKSSAIFGSGRGCGFTSLNSLVLRHVEAE